MALVLSSCGSDVSFGWGSLSESRRENRREKQAADSYERQGMSSDEAKERAYEDRIFYKGTATGG